MKRSKYDLHKSWVGGITKNVSLAQSRIAQKHTKNQFLNFRFSRRIESHRTDQNMIEVKQKT